MIFLVVPERDFCIVVTQIGDLFSGNTKGLFGVVVIQRGVLCSGNKQGIFV